MANTMGVRSKVLHLYCQKAWVNRFWDIIKSTRERALLSIYLSYALCAHLPVHFVILKTYNAILSEIIQTLTTKCSKTETFSLGVGDFKPFEHFFSLHILSISSKYTWANGGHNRNKSGQEEIMSIHFFLLFDILHRLSLCTYTHTHILHDIRWCFSYLDFISLISLLASVVVEWELKCFHISASSTCAICDVFLALFWKWIYC